jgi:hypothetical protein
MATPTSSVAQVLRSTAQKIQHSPEYQWGHMGACNCGHLAQEITSFTKSEIHARALSARPGDWQEQLREYCGESKLPFDEVVTKMLQFGFSLDDLTHLERLNHPQILSRLPFAAELRHNVKDDVALYLHLWADLVEEQVKLIEKPKTISELLVD